MSGTLPQWRHTLQEQNGVMDNPESQGRVGNACGQEAECDGQFQDRDGGVLALKHMK